MRWGGGGGGVGAEWEGREVGRFDEIIVLTYSEKQNSSEVTV